MQNLGIGEILAGDAGGGGAVEDQTFDLRIRLGRAITLDIAVPAGIGFLPMAAHLDHLVGDFRIAVIGRRSAPLLADSIADVEPGHVPHREGPHWQAKIEDHSVDILGQGAILDLKAGLAGIGMVHAIADDAVANTDQDRHFLNFFAQSLHKLNTRDETLLDRSHFRCGADY